MDWRRRRLPQLLPALLWLSVPPSQARGPVDGAYPDVLTRLAFGSCSKQYKNQTLWDPIIDFKPQAWLWMGDVIYVNLPGIDVLRTNYAKQLKQPGYRRLLDTGLVVEGVYDDHDYGVNDGGKESYTQGRQDAYLDFLQHVPEDSPRRTRHGLYSSHTFGPADKQVKVIFLDTRTCRDPPPLDLLPNLWFPFKPLALALQRYVGVILGVQTGYMGDVLGEEQWRWLESQLQDSIAKVHVIVSTIQVLSTNPAVEGWLHFPVAQSRLLALLDRHNPKGLVLLSGDVHFAELLTLQDSRGHLNRQPPLEVTTSGMTHTCTNTALGMCKRVIRMYEEHRETPESYYLGYNYGTMELDWSTPGEGHEVDFVVRVHGAQGQTVLQVNRHVPTQSPGLDYGIKPPYSAKRGLEDPGFTSGLAMLVVIIAIMGLLVVTRGGKRRPTKAGKRL